MGKEIHKPLSLPFLFGSKQGRLLLQNFLQETEIATQKWLLGTAGIED